MKMQDIRFGGEIIPVTSVSSLHGQAQPALYGRDSNDNFQVQVVLETTRKEDTPDTVLSNKQEGAQEV